MKKNKYNITILIAPIDTVEIFGMNNNCLMVYYDEQKSSYGVYVPILEKYHLANEHGTDYRDSRKKRFFKRIANEEELKNATDPIFSVLLDENHLIQESTCINAENLSLDQVFLVNSEQTKQKKYNLCS